MNVIEFSDMILKILVILGHCTRRDGIVNSSIILDLNQPMFQML